MGDVNLEIKLNNLDERVIKIEDSGGGGDSYISSVSTDFNVVNKKLSLSDLITTKLSKVDDKEDSSNKVTTLSSSSTDTQYPSAKCVYDLVGDVESLLASL